MPYWTFELDDTDLNILGEDAELYGSLRTLKFAAPLENSLVILYDKTQNSCLWILSEQDAIYPDLPPLTRNALSFSNPGQILPAGEDPIQPDQELFGPEMAHTWCYYFEKADLARQLEDWAAVSSLGDEAIASGFKPHNDYEWIPFIEGYIHSGNWAVAQTLTMNMLARGAIPGSSV